MCRILGEKCLFKPGSSKDRTFNLGSPLETKVFPPKAMFKFATNISGIINVRIARNTGMAVTRACSGRVQQKILCFMLHDCSQTERL